MRNLFKTNQKFTQNDVLTLGDDIEQIKRALEIENEKAELVKEAIVILKENYSTINNQSVMVDIEPFRG
ncbi:hypothetical protein ABK040_015218 [Willaertia magna]